MAAANKLAMAPLHFILTKSNRTNFDNRVYYGRKSRGLNIDGCKGYILQEPFCFHGHPFIQSSYSPFHPLINRIVPSPLGMDKLAGVRMMHSANPMIG
jgi:hypothetical protein